MMVQEMDPVSCVGQALLSGTDVIRASNHLISVSPLRDIANFGSSPSSRKIQWLHAFAAKGSLRFMVLLVFGDQTLRRRGLNDHLASISMIEKKCQVVYARYRTNLNQRRNATLYLMGWFSVFTFPALFLTSYFGMNFADMEGTHYRLLMVSSVIVPCCLSYECCCCCCFFFNYFVDYRSRLTFRVARGVVARSPRILLFVAAHYGGVQFLFPGLRSLQYFLCDLVIIFSPNSLCFSLRRQV